MADCSPPDLLVPLLEARDAQARAYGPAHEPYLRCKRLGRAALGSRSPQ